MKVSRIEHMCEGNGHVIIKEILEEPYLAGKCGLYAEVTLEPGCSLGYHEHHRETETYYVLSGSATYMDNDKEYEIKTGDVTFCKDGDGHGIKNHGTEPIVFVALVLKK